MLHSQQFSTYDVIENGITSVCTMYFVDDTWNESFRVMPRDSTVIS